jgi:hypothetical protein
MHAWNGWTATGARPAGKPLTWTEWRACQQRTVGDEQHRQAGLPFSERELARLAFVRWLAQTGRLHARVPASSERRA